MGELVLVIEAKLLERVGRFAGYSLDVESYLPILLDAANNQFMDRDRAEEDPMYKQLIPYVVLRYRDAVFQYVRGKRSTESRLRAMRSIGVGGHIEPRDRSLFSSDSQAYLEATAREVSEEVEIGAPYRERIVGLLNDDSTEVGKVHFGIVHVWDLAEPAVRKREGLITQAGFVPIASLVTQQEDLENWSRLTVDVLTNLKVPTYGTSEGDEGGRAV